MPTDLWVPITKDIPPVTSDQVSAGVYYGGLSGWEFSVEAYYKRIDNVLEYGDGVVVIGGSSNWEERVKIGGGRSRGVELFAQKTSGKLTGWLSYTLAKSERIFPDGSVNNGRWFPYKYDRRHNLNLNASYRLNSKLNLNCAWTFLSGMPITLPEGKTIVPSPADSYNRGNTVDFISSRGEL